MARRKARVATQTGVWKKRIYFLFAAASVVTIGVAARQFWGPKAASAQPPATTQQRASDAPQVVPAPAKKRRRSIPLEQQRQLKVMASVNREQISRQRLAAECAKRFGKPVLESILNKHLIMQACLQQGIQITEQDVDAEVQKMAEKFGLSKKRWLQLLRDERDIEPEQYHREIIWPTLALRRLAANEIQVPQQELQRAFESEYGPRVQVLMISVGSLEKAKRVHAQAVAQPDQFGNLAKDHSEERNSAAARGRIPPLRRHMGHDELERAAFSLKAGQISNVIHVAEQYLILKCEKHIPPTYIAEKFRQSTMQKLGDRIRDQKLRGAAAKLFKKMQDGARVENVLNDPNLQRRMPGVAARINGKEVSMRDLGEECLLRNGVDVLDGEINRLLLTQALRKRNTNVTRQDIDAEVARAAVAYGFENADGTPNVKGWLDKITKEEGATVELYVADAVWPTVALKKLVGDRVKVTDEDMKKGFDANYGPRVNVLAIVMTNARQANQVWEMARQNPTDNFFGQLAEQYSVEPVSRSNRGRVPPVRKHGGRPLIENEAFRLKAGELSGIVAVGDKYVIMRCLGRTKPVVQNFNAVRDELFRDISEKKLRAEMTKEYDRLKDMAEIHNYLTGELNSPRSQTGRTTQRGVAPIIRK